MSEPFDHKKNLDLHESEWVKDGKKQPVLGVNGVFFCIFFPLALGAGFLIKWFVATMVDAFGFPNGLIVALVVCSLFIWLAIGPVISAGFDLADFLLRKIRRQ